MGGMVLCRTFYTAPEQGQGPTPIVPYCSGSGPSTRHSHCDYTIKVYSLGTIAIAVAIATAIYLSKLIGYFILFCCCNRTM